MSDEIKTESAEATGTATNNNSVNMTQEKLDQLINQAYARGAKNAKDSSALDEASKQIEALRGTISELEKQSQTLRSESEVKDLAYKYEVKDVEYFKFKLNEAKQQEGFDVDEFVSSFKEGNPSVFKGQSKVNVDNSSNASQPSNQERIKSASSMAELYKLQNELNIRN